MLRVGERREELSAWRNKPLNPFAEPPFQVLWIGNGDENLFAFRAHHAVVDGEGFFGVCAEALRVVANVCNERLLGVRRPDAALVRSSADRDESGVRPPHSKEDQDSEALKGVQKLREEARSNRSARLAVRSCTPGETAVVERDVEIERCCTGMVVCGRLDEGHL